MARDRRYDMVVLGGGTAGLVGAMIAAGAGARVALVERDRTGGDCLWTGCVPSKALLAAAGLAHRLRHAGAVGLTAREPEIDFAAVMGHVDAARRAIEPHDSPERLRASGVEVVHAAARFLGPGALEAGGRTLRFRTALVATGSRPVVPPVDGLEEVALTTETVWDLRRRPARLAVIGGGPVGCELAQGFARLGSRVVLVESEDRLLGKEEPAASRLVERALREEGVDVRLGARVTGVGGQGAERRIAVEAQGEAAFDVLLAAAGRRPATEGLDLAAAGVRTDEGGAVAVDERLRTTARGIYAAGDVTGELPFTHVAAYHARVAVPNALFGLRRRVDYAAVPWVTFTDPEVGRVGLTEAQARERWGERARTARFDYTDSDRAIAAGEARGLALLVGDRRGRLVGATVAAPAGWEVIAMLAALVGRGASIADVSRQVQAYPTLAEGPARAADAYVTERLLGARTRAALRPVLAALRVLDRLRPDG